MIMFEKQQQQQQQTPTKKHRTVAEIQRTNKIRNGTEWEKHIFWGQNERGGRIYNPVLMV